MKSLEDNGAPLVSPGSPTGELEAQVGRLWQEIRPELRPVTEQTHLFDADCRSRHLVALVDAIGRELGAEVVPAEVITSPSVRDTASLVRRRIPEGRAPLLVRLTPGTEGPPLVLLPGSDGTFARLFEITRLLPEKRPCYGFEARGVRPGERPHRSIRSLTRRYAMEIEAEFAREPAVLIGLCLGGTIAHELAHLLAACGTPPYLLVLGDTPCPTRVRTRRPWSCGRRRRRRIRRDLRGWLGIPWDKAGGLEARMIQIRRTFSLAALRHQPQRIETDTVLLTSEQYRRSYRCRDLGWAPFVRGGPKLVELGGGHFDLLRFQSSMTMRAIEEHLADNAL
ncbi:MAG: alpha/beta fold hydrolase [Deltaproteobacteria bacterium]|nr:alpha/beta fold hydrolase [Deltaproteobacteria bacterium]